MQAQEVFVQKFDNLCAAIDKKFKNIAKHV